MAEDAPSEPSDGVARDSPAVAVVDPQTPGNVGTIARAMKNFGFEELLLIDAPELDSAGEAYGFAGQARDDILPDHERPSFDDLVESYYTVGFTATTNENATSHVRYPFATPVELSDELADVDAPVCFVFGREDNGLTNEELARIDRICSIPASAEYPVLNLGQAATISLYELRELAMDDTQLPDPDHDRAREPEIELLYDHFEAFLESNGHPEEKRPKAARMFRRLISRAHPTNREASTLTGIFRRGAQFADPPEEATEE
ncbi:RNA methyltransferase [Salinarchaeum laminariae]|uniref:RNA methyltransferase n=1 Tax=Salinarchaeum laminariae TaxID=869888 RepID=UPI0020BFC6F9|nr:RNA methyltransferase [Salinarchaeum laminariae]